MRRARFLLALVLASVVIVPFRSESQRRQGGYSIEAEDLVSSAKASSGPVTRQDMKNFGRGWSGDAQLFWAPPPPVDRPIRSWPNLTMLFNPPSAGTYEVVLHYTSAPDFATFRVFLDGQQGADIDGYAPAVAPQERSLGQHNLTGGRHQLVVTVFSKARSSRGFSVGLDRIELRPVEITGPGVSTVNPDRGGIPGARPGGTRVPFLAQLNFALVSSVTQKWTEKGGTQRPFDRTNLLAHFVWQAASGNQFAWYWQMSLQQFSGPLSLAPTGLVAQHEVSASTFTIDLGSFPPLNADLTRQRPVDLYIRLIGKDQGQTPVLASNVAVAHYQPGSDQSNAITTEAMKRAEEEKRKAEALAKAYKVEVLSFKPAVFTDPNQWGCVVITKNNDPFLKTSYPPGKHCGQSYKGQSYQAKSPWDYITGWAKAYEVASNFYDEAKHWTAKQFAEALPCEALGKAGSACEKYSEDLAGVAISVGLSAAGVPPSLPSLSALAKGQAVNAGVDFTCQAVENEGGKCSPKLRSALAKAYSAGLDKLTHDLDRVTKEPGCGNEKIAHENGREPLPCFGEYPGVEFEPAPGAVYEPPTVTLRVTRSSTEVSDLPNAELVATIWLKNRFPGGQIESYYQPIPPTDLYGELFAPAMATLPPVGAGRSLTMILPMGGIKQYTFSSKEGGYAVHNGWCYLYNGGSGSVLGSLKCQGPNGTQVSCGAGGELKVQMPKDSNCSQ